MHNSSEYSHLPFSRTKGDSQSCLGEEVHARDCQERAQEPIDCCSSARPDHDHGTSDDDDGKRALIEEGLKWCAPREIIDAISKGEGCRYEQAP